MNLAHRMQSEVPDLLDISGEKQTTLESYGIGNEKTDAFGRKCLLRDVSSRREFVSYKPMQETGTVMTTSARRTGP